MLRTSQIFLGILCFLYFLIIIWLLFFYNGQQNRLIFFSERHFSLIPFKTTSDYIFQIRINPGSLKYKIDFIRDIGGNLLLFFPWSVLGPALFKNLRSTSKFYASAFFISFFAEVIQFVFNIGVLDIDDIIYNTLGALGGLFFFRFIKFLLYKH